MIKCYTLWRGLVELSCERITYRMNKQSAHIRAELVIVVGSWAWAGLPKPSVDGRANRHTGLLWYMEPQTDNSSKWEVLMTTLSQDRNEDYYSNWNKVGNPPINIYQMPQWNSFSGCHDIIAPVDVAVWPQDQWPADSGRRGKKRLSSYF